MKKGGRNKDPVGNNSPASGDCRCGPGKKDRFQCTPEDVFMCVPNGKEKDIFLESFRDGNQASYTLCNSDNTGPFETECVGMQLGKTCSCYDEDDVTHMAFSESAFSCTFEDKMMMYTISNSVCESTTLKTTGYVTTLEQTDPITAIGQPTSPTQTDASVTSSTGGSPPSTRLVTNTAMTTVESPTPSNRRGNSIPVAIGVSLTLIVLLVALIIFVCWKKGGKRFCTKSRRKFNRSQTSTLNPADSSASAGRVNPTYDLDGRLAGGDVLHLTSLANVQKEEESYAEILPRDYASYMPDHPTTSYTALQKVRSTGSDDNDDPPVYTPIPVSNKPAKNSLTDDYVEPDTVPLHPGERANGASALNSSVLGKRQGRHQDVRSPNPKSGGYVDVDSPPVVFSEPPSAPRTSFAEPQDQDPEDVYYFKLRGLSADTAPVEHSTADSGQYQSLGASSATLSADTKLVDDGDAYNMLGRNAINLAKTAANATTNSNYDHMVIQAASHNNGGNNAYNTVERPRLETALKSGDAQHQGATGGIINNNTDLKGQTAGYDVFERPGMKHAINTTGEGDYSLAMPLV
ncbi:uncharacterized protein [Asterias amurensis]|uniref:uncharacterized protein n=1 Tax=Asterias amurensis TaxID=7602 RepID=UPI003AB81E26